VIYYILEKNTGRKYVSLPVLGYCLLDPILGIPGKACHLVRDGRFWVGNSWKADYAF